MNPEQTKGTIAPWLLVVFIIVLLGGSGFLAWHFLGSKPSPTTVTTNPTAVISAKKTSPSPTSISTADWQTYKNDTYGFSFKYPKDWKITVDQASVMEPIYNVEIQNNNVAQLRIDIQKVSAPASLNQLDEDKTLFLKNQVSGNSVSDVVIGGKKAYKYIFGPNANKLESTGNPRAAVIDNDNIYSINFFNDAVSQFDQLISTFQFTK